jgi:hypothetical protein
MNCVPLDLPAFWAEGHIVTFLKVIIERWARVHLCQQLQLSFKGCQLSGKFEAATLYREDLFLQIENKLYKLAVLRFFDYFPNHFERADWIHVHTLCHARLRTSFGKTGEKCYWSKGQVKAGALLRSRFSNVFAHTSLPRRIKYKQPFGYIARINNWY